MKNLIIRILIIGCSFLSTTFLQAQSWVASSGPEGGAIGPVIYHKGDVFTFTNEGMYRSTNLGDSWAQHSPSGVDASKVTLTLRNSITAVGDYLYAYVDNKLIASSNGQSWAPRDNGITYPTAWGAGLSYSGSNFYVAFSNGEAYKSSNQGSSFFKLGRGGITSGSNLRLIVEAGANLVGSVYAEGLYYSTDGGQNWSRPAGGPTTTVSSLVYVGGIVYATVDHPNASIGGLFVSTNNGQSFTKKNSQAGLLNLMEVGGKVFLYTRTKQTFEVTNGGNNVTLYTNVSAMPYFMSSNGGNIWFAITNRGAHRSGDSGASWGLANKGLGFAAAKGFENIGDTYFLVGNGGVWKTSTQAIRWVPTATIAAVVNDLAVDGNKLYASTETSGIYVSTNKGDSWQQIGTGFPTANVAGTRIEVGGGHVFVFVRQGTDQGLYKLTNSTGSWQKILPSGGFGSISVVGNRLYVQTKYSDNWGVSWSNVSGISGSGEVYGYVRNSNYVYAHTYPYAGQKPIYRSSDGKNFSNFSTGLHDEVFSNPTSAVAKGDSIFLLSDNGSKTSTRKLFAYVTTSTSSGWTKILDGLPQSPAPGTNSLYATDYSILLGTRTIEASVYRLDFATIPPQDPNEDIVEYPPLGPSISLTASPQTIDLSTTGSASTTLTVTANGGFTGSVDLSIIESLPIGLTTNFSKDPISTQGTSTLTFNSSGVAAGTYSFKVLAKSGSLESTTTITLKIAASAQPDFDLSATVKSLNVPQGAFGTSSISFTPSGGFTGAISLSIDPSTPVPAGVTASFNPASISSGSSTLRLDVAATTAPAGPVTLTVKGVSGSITETIDISLTITEVTEPTFVLNATPQSIIISQGGGADINVTITALAGFNQDVELTASIVQFGLYANFSPNFVTGSGESLLTITADEDADLGAGELTITATSGSIVRTVSIALQVEPPPVVVIPANQFSPNGDGIDDTWQITDIDKAPQLAIMVFDRSGRLVFQTASYQNDWDGTHNGKQLLPTTYFYVIRNEKGENVESGSVNLIR